MARKMKTMDGNHAAAHASYAYSDVGGVYRVIVEFEPFSLRVFPLYFR